MAEEQSPSRKTNLKQAKSAGIGLRRALDQLTLAAQCILSFAAFVEEAKPEEIRLLGAMLAEWQNWGGSLRTGNFFAGVARAVLDQDTEGRLRAWPEDRRKVVGKTTGRGRSSA